MVEPANTPWGRFVFKNFHHEPFEPSGDWYFESEGPLSSANGALPWILFCRDREKFESRFPQLKIRSLKQHMPFLYLISGGVSYRQLLPGFFYPLVWGMEKLLSPFNRFLGMFLTVTLEKVD
jgi:hypothetical protein